MIRIQLSQRLPHNAAGSSTSAVLASVILLLLGLSPTAGNAQGQPIELREWVEALRYQDTEDVSSANQAAAATSESLTPPSFPNPYVSFLPKPAPPSHYKAWDRYMLQQAQLQARSARTTQAAAQSVQEQEENGSIGTAQAVVLDSRSEQNHLIIQGTSGEDSVEFTQKFAFAQEDDGAIPLANEVTFDALFQTVTYIAAIGDGPFGSSGAGSGDFDYYQLDLEAGQTIEGQITGADSSGSFVPVLIIIDENEVFTVAVDDPFDPVDGGLKFVAPVDGSYYAIVADVRIPRIPDTQDSGSGLGALGEGMYKLELSLIEETDSDFFAFQLEAGDVLGASIVGRSEPSLGVFSSDGELEVGTVGPSTFPIEESPLPADGQTTLSLVAPESGRYFIEVAQNLGPYELELVASRPGLELTPGRKQILYIDFTGEEINLEPGFGANPNADLSPFGDFLPDWGIENSVESRTQLAERIVATVEENVERDLRESGVNSSFDVEIVSDFGVPQLAEELELRLSTSDDPVSRVIVGGTIEESGIRTLGIAETIDPGNFATEEVALLLLDILSAPATPGASADTTASLNDVQLAPGTTIEDVVAVVVGNLASHEAGHYLGNYHTDGLNDNFTIMDEGPGGLFVIAGIGPSGVFGAADQLDVDFGTDRYSTLEGQFGENDTQANTAFALSFIPVGDTSLIAVYRQATNGIVPAAGARLSQSYPNPQAPNQRSQIGFTTPDQGAVSLDIYDVRGNHVANLFSGEAKAGQVHQVTLDAQKLNLRRGVYVYKLTTADGEQERRIIITE